MSQTFNCGLPIVSAYSTLVRGVSPRRKASGSSASTKVTSMPKLRERGRELRICPAVERARGDDVIAVAAQGEEREHLRRHAGRRRERGPPAFQRRHSLLERCDGGIRDPRVDVAERLQVEEARRVVRAVEHERSRLVDRAARARRSPHPGSGPRAGRACRSRTRDQSCPPPIGAARRSPQGGERLGSARRRLCDSPPIGAARRSPQGGERLGAARRALIGHVSRK